MTRPDIYDDKFNDPEGYTDMEKYSKGLNEYIDYLESVISGNPNSISKIST